MPELPEVETVRSRIAPALEGREIVRVEILDPRLTRPADPEAVASRLDGQRVTKVFTVRNTAEAVAADQGVFRDRVTGEPSAGRKAVHYYMDPRDQLRAYNDIDAAGLDLIGYYHSHTHTEARPSATDIRLATDLSR